MLGEGCGCAGSSSGSTSDLRSRGPEFDSHWEWAFSLFSSINQRCVLKQVPCGGAALLIFNFPTKMKAYLCSLSQSKLTMCWMNKKGLGLSILLIYLSPNKSGSIFSFLFCSLFDSCRRDGRDLLELLTSGSGRRIFVFTASDNSGEFPIEGL